MFYPKQPLNGTAMPDRRGRKGSIEDLFPEDRLKHCFALVGLFQGRT
jgi:hypothetical protein